jgi:hypothetical protein
MHTISETRWRFTAFLPIISLHILAVSEYGPDDTSMYISRVYIVLHFFRKECEEDGIAIYSYRTVL